MWLVLFLEHSLLDMKVGGVSSGSFCSDSTVASHARWGVWGAAGGVPGAEPVPAEGAEHRFGAVHAQPDAAPAASVRPCGLTRDYRPMK